MSGWEQQPDPNVNAFVDAFNGFSQGGGGSRQAGMQMAANGLQDPSQPLVMSDAGPGGGLTADQVRAMQLGRGPRTSEAASKVVEADDLAEMFFGAWDRSPSPMTHGSAGVDYGDALTSMNGGTPGAGAFATGLTPAQFGQSMIDMYIKAPINLIPGFASDVVNGHTGIWNVIAGNGPTVGTLNLRPLNYSDPIAGALGEFGASVLLPAATTRTVDLVSDVRAVAAMDNATLGAMPGYVRQARTAQRGVLEVELAPHLQAEAKGYKGVKVTENGGPTFANTEYLYPVEHGQRSVVEITMTGSRRLDFEQANRVANLTDVVPKGFNTPKGYIWHHVDDFDPFTGRSTLQLVRVDAHVAATPHAGSVRQYESYYRTKYR